MSITTVVGKVALTPQGVYNPATTYNVLDVVQYEGSSYIVLQGITGVTPSDDGVNYHLMASIGATGDVTPAATAAAAAAAASASDASTSATDAADSASAAASSASTASAGASTVTNALTEALGNANGFEQNATGAVLRTFTAKDQERISILDFGGDPTGNSYNDAALEAALASVSSNSNVYYIGGPRIYFPPGYYKFQYGIDLKVTCILEGDAAGINAGWTTVLSFPDGILAGITINRYNTLAGGVQSTPTTGADGTIIRNLALVGGWSGTVQSPGTTHGVWMRARATLDNVSIYQWSGCGVQVLANSAGTGASQGNANGWQIKGGNIYNCGIHGIFVSGTDANAGKADTVNIGNCNLSGIMDSSYLMNTYIACEVATVSLQAQVSDGTYRYYCINGTGAGTTPPASNPACWVQMGTGGTNNPSFPLWVSGNTYAPGPTYGSTNANSYNVFLGCYGESNSAPCSFVSPTIVIGGNISSGAGNGWAPGSTGSAISANTNGLVLSGITQNAKSGALNAWVYTQNTSTTGVHGYVAYGDLGNGLQFNWDNTNGCWMYEHANSVGRVPFRLTTNLNSITCGLLTAPLGGQIIFGQGFYLGSSTTNARLVSNGTAAPTTGYHALGERWFNISPAPGGNSEWVCTTAGYAGTATAWAASTAYATLGTFVSNGGNTYVLTGAGTSASSGGPTGTGTGITDGTCTWNYVPVAVFSKAGAVNLEGSASYAGGTITAGTSVVLATITATGAAMNDFAVPSLSVSNNGLIVTANVTSANTVQVMAANVSTASVTLAACTVMARVFKQ
jgi:hypothetical protein